MVKLDVNIVFYTSQGYSTLPGYGKETLRPITIWKGNSFTTISARHPQISGKDSGKGDSDFNDSDSDISGDVHKKESPPTNSKYRPGTTIICFKPLSSSCFIMKTQELNVLNN